MTHSPEHSHEHSTSGIVPADATAPAAAPPQAPPMPGAPPTAPGELRHWKSEPSWPMAIGIIAIVFGVGGVLVSGYGVLSAFMFAEFSAWVPQAPDDPTRTMFDAMARWKYPLAIASGFGVPVACVLLAGGVLLVRRRPAARTVILIWAALRALQGTVATIVQALAQRDQMQAMEASMAAQGPGGPPPGFFGTMSQVVVIATLVFGLLWVIALPTFMAIWFTRPGVLATVKKWRARDQARRPSPDL